MSKANENPTPTNLVDPMVEEKLVKREDATYLASVMRENSNRSLGVILTLVDASMGDSVQSKALKQSIKREMYTLMDHNQQHMYVMTGQQDRVFNHTTYITSDYGE